MYAIGTCGGFREGRRERDFRPRVWLKRTFAGMSIALVAPMGPTSESRSSKLQHALREGISLIDVPKYCTRIGTMVIEVGIKRE